MDNNNKRDKIAKIIGIIIGIILVIGISYALFTAVLSGKKKARVTTGTLSLELIEDSETNPSKYTKIELDNTVPMKDENGLNTTPYVFTLKNKGNIDARYILSLEVGTDSTLPAGDIKFAIEKINNSDVFKSNPLLLSNVSSHENNINNIPTALYDISEGVIDVNQSIDFKLRVWVDYDAGISASDKTFTAILRVSGVQKNK